MCKETPLQAWFVTLPRDPKLSFEAADVLTQFFYDHNPTEFVSIDVISKTGTYDAPTSFTFLIVFR